ncbi:MAG: acetyl-CoA carboxylase biotin carboxylase subunit [Planctomycetota bacterium]|jgi:acetyl-CoA carboxylase biotin carboxylase subunit
MSEKEHDIRKVLVANRGEIAVRVIRSLREMSIPSVAVYSTADADALHVRLAEESVWIGDSHPLTSYLDVDALMRAAVSVEADALHPGYGFLSENWRLARRCEEEGLTFIGPPSGAIRVMGDKIEARRTLAPLSIPMLPASRGAVDLDDDLADEALEVGYPLLVKARAGGGGRGMRLVHEEPELRAAVESAKREASKAFGDDTVFLERAIADPRHVEFQILGDRHGNFVHLHERECSIQRRKQKIVEETPCSGLDDALRSDMGRTAISVAEAAGSFGACTVEFLLDAGGDFFFLEMNTRIQVEHPVTEETTGIDLVGEQIRIARGEVLDFRQEDVSPRGHALQCRIYAEDPEKDFLPSPGRIRLWREPRGPGVRVDSGVDGPCTVPVEYDPLLAKLIVRGADRTQAIGRMIEALKGFVVFGIPTTIPFLREVIDHPAFRAGRTSTGFLEKHFASWKKRPGTHFAQALSAACAVAGRGGNGSGQEENGRPFDPWREMGKWELGMR